MIRIKSSFFRLFVLLLAFSVSIGSADAQRRKRKRATPRRATVHRTGGNHHAQRMALFDREGAIDSTTIVMRIGTTQRIVNRGIIGDNTVSMTERLYQITPYNPRAIFLMAGINDMVGNTTAEQVAQRVIKLIETIRTQAPQTQLFVQSILPIDETDGRWKTLAGRTDDIPFANMLIKAYCETHDLVFVDIFHRMTRGRSNQLRRELSGDGLHLTEQGYRVWAFELKKYVDKL